MNLPSSFSLLARMGVILLCLGICTPTWAVPAPLHLNFVNSNSKFTNDNVYVTFYVGISSNGDDSNFQATLNGTRIAMTQGSRLNDKDGNAIYDTTTFFLSQPYSLTQLASGIDVTAATSVRFYITLGAPLKTGIGDPTPRSGVLTFGLPGPLSGTADPNWYIRWDAMELTYNGDPADYGDIQTINLFGIPLQVQNFKNGSTTPLQTVRTIQSYTNPSLLSQLETLANANLANGSNYTPAANIPSNWYVTDSEGNFLRLISAATAPVGAAGPPPVPSVIGPYPSFNPYVDYVCTDNITTPLTDTVNSVAYNFTASAATSGAASAIVLTGTVTGGGSIGAGHTLKMVVPPDTNVGLTTASYPLSNAVYGAAYLANPDVQYYVDGNSVTQATFLSDAGGETTIDQLFHDLASGYNFGFIGNSTQITNSGLNGGQPISLNDMGSAGWRTLGDLLKNNHISLGDIHLFSLTGPGGQKFYNQWAALIYGNSTTVYGFAYSDFLQPVALYSDSYNSTPVNSWTVTVMPDTSSPNSPVITSAAGATFAVGKSNSFTVTATGTPAPTFGTTGPLPTWASLNSTTGVLSGTPPDPTGAPFTLNLTAANGNLPDASQVFTLNVQPAQTFSAWMTSHSFNGGPTDIPQNDRVPNLLKYLYNINPSVPMGATDIAALPVVGTTTIEGIKYLTLTYRQYALETGITINLQTSSDLQNWTTLSNSSVIQVNTDSHTGDPIMQAQVPLGGTRQFIRLNVTMP